MAPLAPAEDAGAEAIIAAIRALRSCGGDSKAEDMLTEELQRRRAARPVADAATTAFLRAAAAERRRDEAAARTKHREERQ
eukprot:4908860-Alexandrium_andersonii.AAC.1